MSPNWPKMDPRYPLNTKPHTQVTFSAKDLSGKMTPARAAKLRRLSYAACMCRLCALALRPPATFEEWAAFVGDLSDAHPPKAKHIWGESEASGSHLSVVR